MKKLHSEKIAILLSTYNGKLYIEKQVISLMSQSFNDFILYIRDDGSSDGTELVLRELAKRYNNIVLLPSGKNYGAAGSFIELINNVEADYYFFCDQDDYWLPEKIEVTLKAISCYDQKKPLLAHSNLLVVDKDLELISNSFYEYSNISIERFENKKQILLQNYIVGCTCCINNTLAELAKISQDEVKKIAMHDWWFALYAKFFGEIIYVEQPTIKYRQHDNNTLGANNNSLRRYLKLFFNNSGISRVNKFRAKMTMQAFFFEEKNKSILTVDDKKYFEDIHLLEKDKNIFDVLNFFLIKRNSFMSYKRNLAFIYSSFFLK